MKSTRKLLILGLVMAFTLTISARAQDQDRDHSKDRDKAEDQSEESKRVHKAANVMDEIMSTPDKGIPDDLLKSAKCVGVVPSMIKGGFIVGGRYGKGVATCRTANGWSAPAPLEIAGGSWGLQIGGEAVDLVMLVMNDRGMEHLLSSKFKLGADASAAAGPVGRHTEATTDWKLKAEVLTYSRARGVFAGLELNGAVVKQDDEGTRLLYGKMEPFEAILKGNVPTPPDARTFVATVSKYAGEARTQASR